MNTRLELHGHVVEVLATCTGLPPDDKSGLSLNSTSVFWRVDDGKWHHSPFRSHMETVRLMPHLMDMLSMWELIESARS